MVVRNEWRIKESRWGPKNPSTQEPTDSSRVIRWSDEWWATVAHHSERRCTAHRKNGDRCKRAAISGGNVCPQHGGRARQVVAKARLRLMENVDPAVKQLLKIAFDDNSPIETRLKATLAAIDALG